MSAGWTLALLAVGTVIAVVAASWRRRVEAAEFGMMSTRWIAEHRATESHYDAGR
jgi:hypothetical protein